MVAALESWPEAGIPRNPGAWLTATAKNRQIDLARRNVMFQRRAEDIGRELAQRQVEALEQLALAPTIDDDVLRLVFTTCHPALSRESQVALALRLLGGLSTDEIARALLTSESTVGQRISRAKRTLADAGSPFEVPGEDELQERLAAVLGVVYLIFNEGYAATSGEDLVRFELCEDALRMSRMLQGLLPDEPEVHGLAALLELQASRLRARTGADGEAVLLQDQDRASWDRTLIRRGLDALDRAVEAHGTPGIYSLQAEIAACHAQARSAEETDWRQIALLYRGLSQLTGSPVVELNRAVAVGMAEGPEAGLRVLDGVAGAKELGGYHLLPAVRGDLLERAGRGTEAAEQFERAAAMTRNERERAVLEQRVRAIRTGP